MTLKKKASSMKSSLLSDFANVDNADSKDLVERLDVMHGLEFFKAYKTESFDFMEIKPGMHVADVGCGSGEDVRRLVDRVGNAGSVTGFDISAAMIAEAKRRHAGLAPRVRFVKASAESLGAPDDAFDALRTDRVYVHLTDPMAALREARRVVRRGGKVVVCEPDMLSFWATTSQPDVMAVMSQGVGESVSNGPVTRELYHLFQMAGFGNVRVFLRPLLLFRPEPAERVLDFPVIAQKLAENGRLTAEQVDGWFKELAVRKAEDRFLGGITFFSVVAEVR